MSWKFRSLPFAAKSTISEAVGVTFSIAMPLVVESLLDVFNRIDLVPKAAHVGDGDAGAEGAHRPVPLIKIITVAQYPIKFLLRSLSCAAVSIERGVVHNIEWKQPKWTPHGAEDDGMAGADRGDGDDDGADDLERALSEVMGDLPDHEDFKNFDLDSDGSRDEDDTPVPPAPPVT